MPGTRQRREIADRAVERLDSFPTRIEAEQRLDRLAGELGSEVVVTHGLRYAYQERRGATYPAREEFYTIAPAHVRTKARYGVEWFDAQWDAPQGELFRSGEAQGKEELCSR